jgi:hypothetical protein
LQPLHTEPSTPPLQNDAPLGGGPHCPTLAPMAMLHTPEQQSAERPQMSPCWMQNDAAMLHLPAVQSAEQHSVLLPHALPAVLQLALSAWQLPPAQEWPQQSESVEHAMLSERQALVEPHLPSAPQLRLQQSVATAQGSALAAQ